MQENSLHVALKSYFAGETGQQEVWVDGYLIDVVLDDLLIEVQTRSFSSIKHKLSALLPAHKILLVHPVPLVKWIVHRPVDSENSLSRRKSPRKGRLEHLFTELVRFPEFINNPNLTICLVMTHEEEIRCQDGRGSWRRKGASIIDRTLLEIQSMQLFASAEDFRKLLPGDLEQPFTNRQLAKACGMRIELARKMTYCLRQMEVIEVDGKRRREFLYKVRQPVYNLETTCENGENYER